MLAISLFLEAVLILWIACIFIKYVIIIIIIILTPNPFRGSGSSFSVSVLSTAKTKLLL